MDSFNSKKFVFICGLHRSGTKMLHDVLSAHDDISGFSHTGVHDDEGQYLQSVFPTSDVLGGAGFFGEEKSAVNDETSPLNSIENQQKLWSDWSKHWDTSKVILLEKSPTNMLNTRLLQAFFPNSTFILIMRHPVAVTYSTQLVTGRRRYNISLLDSMLSHWLQCHRQFMQDSKQLANKHMLHYETLVENPNETINTLYDLLELPHHKIGMPIYKTTNDKYFNRWWSKSQSVFAHYNMQALIRKYEKDFNQFGYSLISPKAININTFFNKIGHVNHEF